MLLYIKILAILTCVLSFFLVTEVMTHWNEQYVLLIGGLSVAAMVCVSMVAWLLARQASEARAHMNHEIRTPLNSLLGLSELLLTTELTAHQAQLVRMVLESGESMFVLINTGLNSPSDNVLPLADTHKAVPLGDNTLLADAGILLVEDHRANRDLAIMLLEGFGCHVTAVRNGEEAIEIVKRQPFDLILMDCEMPEMDGFEASSLLCHMKQRKEIADIPIIALTAYAMMGDREKCLASGMNDYITKPLRKDALRNVLIQWLPPRQKRMAAC